MEKTDIKEEQILMRITGNDKPWSYRINNGDSCKQGC